MKRINTGDMLCVDGKCKKTICDNGQLDEGESDLDCGGVAWFNEFGNFFMNLVWVEIAVTEGTNTTG